MANRADITEPNFFFKYLLLNESLFGFYQPLFHRINHPIVTENRHSPVMVFSPVFTLFRFIKIFQKKMTKFQLQLIAIVVVLKRSS